MTIGLRVFICCIFACKGLAALLLAAPALGSAQALAAQTASTQAPSAWPASAQVHSLDAMERQRVLDAVVADMRKYYFDRAVAEKAAQALLELNRSGEYAGKDAAAFAALLTQHLREASGDMHLSVDYFEEPLPARMHGPSAQAQKRYRAEMERTHCTIGKAAILEHNIGYLKIDSFPDPQVCEAEVRAAMASLNHADAIVFDLRDNRGGDPAMVSLVASYLFDHPEYMFNPRQAPSVESWTRSPVAGNDLSDKPAYILTSAATFSGAEQFSYDLKMLKRATLIGETTGGGAHAGVFHRLDDHFGMGIPEVKAINPYGKSDWEGTGVEPDVKVKAADALETALGMAVKELQRK